MNVAVRILALSRRLREELAEHKQWSAGFPPTSEAKKDWPQLSEQVVSRLRTVAEASSRDEVRSLIEPISTLQESRAWTELYERRGKDFHRWRPQSAGLAGVSQQTPWVLESPGRWRISQYKKVDYRDADRLAEEVSRIATNGMNAVGHAMQDFVARFAEASSAVGGPELTWVD